METTVIYVGLVGEAVDVWRPVDAEILNDGTYWVPDAPLEEEDWQFPPGSRVRAEMRSMSDGPALVAVQLLD